MYADHFQPEKVLAAGPAAKVYRAVEAATGRKVLIKALLDDHEATHPLDREKVQLLVPSLMQVRHPQIAGFITLIPSEDEFALVYEYMRGQNARAFAAERRPSPADVRALAVQLMHALLVGEHLRQPHGDPKPSNLIIADHPGGGLFLQVQDWGLSLARTEHPPETLWFRAPELHGGGMPTLQSDLFTAAASLFCIATNTAPAQGSTVEQIMADWQAFSGDVIRHMRPDLDPPLIDWLTWLMNLSPQMRPQSVGQALDMLMRTMHTGFIHMPQQPPVMEPGTQTTTLTRPPSSSNVPRPKPPVARPPSGIEARKEAKPEAPPPPPPRNKKRVFAAVTLNLAALVLIGFFGWGWLSANGAGLWKDVRDWAGSFKVEAVSAPAAVEAAPATEPVPQPPAAVTASKPKSKPKASKAKPVTTTVAKPAESKK